jgi:hypothetical protein
VAEEVEVGFLVGVGVVGAEAHFRRRPSGVRFPLVLMPWPLSIRIFIAD